MNISSQVGCDAEHFLPGRAQTNTVRSGEKSCNELDNWVYQNLISLQPYAYKMHIPSML